METEYSEVNKLEVNNCIRRFTHSNVKINKRKNIVTDKIIQVQYNNTNNINSKVCGHYKINNTIDIRSIVEWPWPRDSERKPLFSPLFKDRELEAGLIRPGIASILIPNE